MRKLTYHPKQHILAKLVHKMSLVCVFSEMKVYVYSLIDLSQVTMKVALMFLAALTMRVSWF